jgi:predicted permease
MSENLTIALKVVPVILLIALGVILEKTKFLNDDAIQGMKKRNRLGRPSKNVWAIF